MPNPAPNTSGSKQQIQQSLLFEPLSYYFALYFFILLGFRRMGFGLMGTPLLDYTYVGF